MRAAMSDSSNTGVKLTDSNLQMLQRANYLFHSAHNWLATEALEKENLLWRTRPKYHKLDHIVYDCAPEVSPLKLSCYTDEDAMGKLKKLAMISYPNQMGRQVLSRYAAYTCVRWLRRLTE
ncbi:unnamed protein product [Cladocopium goreaui]|uniref:Uncharacterized protein n=1 Tax=Cladocopium goreaui TaxID=2562237 RepID=A0A9P1FUU8_9DINO|nr:unnamed protein product [Cladocopium goreaui]